MNDVKLAHPSDELLIAFAQGRLGDSELSEVHAHLADCTACRDKAEAVGDDTLVALLRKGDTEPTASKPNEPREDDTVAAASTMPKAPGLPADLAQHGRYRVQELLGVGGMGAVYKAEHLLMERSVALKLISHSLTSNPAMVERFRREVKTAGQLKHPNIVMAYDAEQAGDSHFLVMEYVEGKSLSRVVADQGPLPVREACEYIRQAACGLEYAHQRGMVHRDIKPQNLMLTPDGQVKILDFGLARFAMESAPAPLAALPEVTGNSSTDSLTQVGIVMGTPDYIAPEQANDAHTADIRADIYSLGCTLYDLLAGHAPFADGGTVMSKVVAHMERMPKPLSEVRKDVPAELSRIVERMMAKDPAKRYQTPAEAAAALARFAAGVAGNPLRKPRTWVALAVAAAFAFVFGAGFVFYWQTPHGVVRFEINDPDIKVVIDGDRHTITGADKEPISVKAGTHGLTIQRGDFLFNTTSFEMKRGKETTIKVDWHDGAKMVVMQDGREIGSKTVGSAGNKQQDKDKRRNPFGVPDVDDPDGAESQAWASQSKLTGKGDDPNAEQWVTRATKGDRASLDGEWYGRWRRPHLKEDWVYCEGTAKIKTVGDRVYILYKDHTDTFLTEARRENGRLVGRVQGTTVRNDNGPCIFVIVGPDRLDGEFDDASGGRGRIDFRRKLEQTDREAIQGAWKPVSVSVQGQQMPELLFAAIGPSITFAANKVTWKTNPNLPGKDLADSPLAKFNLDGVFSLDPAKSPKTIDMTVLGKDPKTPLGTPAPRALLGIYKLDGDTLEICTAIDPEHLEDRPAKFESVAGKWIVHMVLKRAPAPPSEEAKLQGNWQAELVEEAGKTLQVDLLAQLRLVTLAVEPGKARLMSWGYAEGPLELGEYKGIKHIAIGPSATNQNRLLGIYRFEGDKLRLCYRIHQNLALADVYPTDFTDGRDGVTVMVLRPIKSNGSALPAKGRLVTSFGTGFKPITRDGITEDAGGWRIDARDKRIVRLYEVQPPLEECLLYFRAKLKSANLDGRAYPELWARFPHGGEFFSKDPFTFVMGTGDWKTVQVPFILQREERPDLFKLNLHIETAGTVWIKDIELWQAPLLPTMKRPSNFLPMADDDKVGTVMSFVPGNKYPPVTKDGVTADQKAWKIEAKGERTVELYNATYPGNPPNAITYRAQLKSADLQGKAYLEIAYTLQDDKTERFSKNVLMPLTGTTDWASYETSVALPVPHRADRIKLNVRIEGRGTVWVRDVELLRGPLAK